MIEDYLNQGKSLEEAVRLAALMLRGSYAFAVISPFHEDVIICVKKESPLVIGLAQNYTCCSSDVPALPRDVDKVIIMNDGEMAILRPMSVIIKDLTSGKELTPNIIPRESLGGLADKGEYPHYMIKEIYEQPQVAINVINAPRYFIHQLAKHIADADKVYLIGCGTSYHACLYGSYILRYLCEVESQSIIASEFEFSHINIKDGQAILAISQSGETADVLHVLRKLQGSNVKLLALTNVMGSSITRLVSSYVGIYAGPEIGVAATKTFLAQLMMLTRIAIETSKIKSVNMDLAHEIEELMHDLPKLINKALSINDAIARSLSAKMALKHHAFFLARGINVATAFEGALKLKEISYIHAEGYPAGESKHGPIALVEEDYPCIFVSPRDETYDKIIGNIMEMKARGAYIISCVEEGDRDVSAISDVTFVLPELKMKILTPILHVVPLQLLAYYTAVTKGLDPDKPRNLAKSVTVL